MHQKLEPYHEMGHRKHSFWYYLVLRVSTCACEATKHTTNEISDKWLCECKIWGWFEPSPVVDKQLKCATNIPITPCIPVTCYLVAGFSSTQVKIDTHSLLFVVAMFIFLISISRKVLYGCGSTALLTWHASYFCYRLAPRRLQVAWISWQLWLWLRLV